MKTAVVSLLVFLFFSTIYGLPARSPKPFHGMHRLGKIWKLPFSKRGMAMPNRNDDAGILVA